MKIPNHTQFTREKFLPLRQKQFNSLVKLTTVTLLYQIRADLIRSTTNITKIKIMHKINEKKVFLWFNEKVLQHVLVAKHAK